MSLNISLYTIGACLILDNKGDRLYAKYYNKNDNNQHRTLQQQIQFEKTLFEKINKVNQDIILYDNQLITYKQSNDVILVLVAALSENESLLYSLTSNLNEALNILLGSMLDKATILDKYDLVSLCIDEAIDDGIILEIDPAIIVSRVTDAPTSSGMANDMNLHIDLSEKGLFNALSFASRKIGERLQQGL